MAEAELITAIIVNVAVLIGLVIKVTTQINSLSSRIYVLEITVKELKANVKELLSEC